MGKKKIWVDNQCEHRGVCGKGSYNLVCEGVVDHSKNALLSEGFCGYSEELSKRLMIL